MYVYSGLSPSRFLRHYFSAREALTLTHPHKSHTCHPLATRCPADHLLPDLTKSARCTLILSLPTMTRPPIPSRRSSSRHRPPRPLTLLFLFLTGLLTTPSSSSCHALPPLTLVQTYSAGPVILSAHATLHHAVDLGRNSVKLGLVFSDATALCGGAAWVGIGIGEPSSGSMLGADIVTAEFPAHAFNNTCVLTDRYVPWDAYPARPYPAPDPCGRTPSSDWTLVSCIRDPTLGVVVLEVVRPITVERGNDVYDRSIVPYDNAFLYAYGDGGVMQYHGGMNRKSTRVTFYTPMPEAVSDTFAATVDDDRDDNHENSHSEGNVNGSTGFVVPGDADGFFDLVATDYEVPQGSVTYACTSTAIPLPRGGGGDRMIVAAEAIINTVRAGDDEREDFESPVHHFTVYICGGDSYARKTTKTVACNGANTGTSGPLANPKAQCSTFVFGCKLSIM